MKSPLALQRIHRKKYIRLLRRRRLYGESLGRGVVSRYSVYRNWPQRLCNFFLRHGEKRSVEPLAEALFDELEQKLRKRSLRWICTVRESNLKTDFILQNLRRHLWFERKEMRLETARVNTLAGRLGISRAPRARRGRSGAQPTRHYRGRFGSKATRRRFGSKGSRRLRSKTRLQPRRFRRPALRSRIFSDYRLCALLYGQGRALSRANAGTELAQRLDPLNAALGRSLGYLGGIARKLQQHSRLRDIALRHRKKNRLYRALLATVYAEDSAGRRWLSDELRCFPGLGGLSGQLALLKRVRALWLNALAGQSSARARQWYQMLKNPRRGENTRGGNAPNQALRSTLLATVFSAQPRLRRKLRRQRHLLGLSREFAFLRALRDHWLQKIQTSAAPSPRLQRWKEALHNPEKFLGDHRAAQTLAQAGQLATRRHRYLAQRRAQGATSRRRPQSRFAALRRRQTPSARLRRRRWARKVRQSAAKLRLPRISYTVKFWRRIHGRRKQPFAPLTGTLRQPRLALEAFSTPSQKLPVSPPRRSQTRRQLRIRKQLRRRRQPLGLGGRWLDLSEEELRKRLQRLFRPRKFAKKRRTPGEDRSAEAAENTEGRGRGKLTPEAFAKANAEALAKLRDEAGTKTEDGEVVRPRKLRRREIRAAALGETLEEGDKPLMTYHHDQRSLTWSRPLLRRLHMVSRVRRQQPTLAGWKQPALPAFLERGAWKTGLFVGMSPEQSAWQAQFRLACSSLAAAQRSPRAHLLAALAASSRRYDQGRRRRSCDNTPLISYSLEQVRVTEEDGEESRFLLVDRHYGKVSRHRLLEDFFRLMAPEHRLISIQAGRNKYLRYLRYVTKPKSPRWERENVIFRWLREDVLKNEEYNSLRRNAKKTEPKPRPRLRPRRSNRLLEPFRQRLAVEFHDFIDLSEANLERYNDYNDRVHARRATSHYRWQLDQDRVFEDDRGYYNKI